MSASDPLRSAILRQACNTVAVSYTHLDVYKRQTHGAALAHFLDDAEDAFLGRGCDAVAHLHALLLQQLVDRLELGRAIENDRFAPVSYTHLGDIEAARQAWQQGIAAAQAKGDKQAEKEMSVFLRKLDKPTSNRG